MSIQSTLRSYESALNSSAIDAILDLYGSEPVFMPQHAPALVGLARVRPGAPGSLPQARKSPKATTSCSYSGARTGLGRSAAISSPRTSHAPERAAPFTKEQSP